MIVFTEEEVTELQSKVNEQGEGYLHYANGIIEKLFEKKYGWSAIDYDEMQVYAPNAEYRPYGLYRPFKAKRSQFDTQNLKMMSFDIFSTHKEMQEKIDGIRYYISFFGNVGYFVVSFDTIEHLKEFAKWRDLEVDYWRIERPLRENLIGPGSEQDRS